MTTNYLPGSDSGSDENQTQYEAPVIETILSREDIEREVLYAGRPSSDKNL